jgi:hypothetical protein
MAKKGSTQNMPHPMMPMCRTTGTTKKGGK